MKLPITKIRLKKRISFKSSSCRDALVFTAKSLVFLFFLILLLANFQKYIFNEGALNNPEFPKFYENRAKAYLDNNNFSLSSYFNNLGLSKFPTDINLLKQKDLIYIRQNERKFVISDINFWLKIAARHPDYRDAYAQIVYAYLKLGDRENAKKYLQIVENINPDWPLLEKLRL